MRVMAYTCVTYITDEGSPPTSKIHKHLFYSCDLDLDPMTLTCVLDLDILKMCQRTKNELSRSRLLKDRALQTDTQTDAIPFAAFARGKDV